MKSFQIHPYIISLIFLFGNTIVAYSENLISESIYQGGLYYGFDHVFSEASPLRFSLNDHNLPGKWSCRLKTTSENMADIPVDINGGYCNFNPTAVPFYMWAEKAFRTFNSLDNRDEFTLYVSFRSESGEYDERSVRLGLLPCRPSLNNIQFKYQYDWTYDQIYPNGTFSFEVEANNSKTFFLHYSKSFLPPSKNIFFAFTKEFQEENHAVISYDADWGEYVTVSAGNEFGFVNSDTIYTTDYIQDENVIKRINEILGSASNIPVIENAIPFSWDNEIIRFYTMPRHVCVYSIEGRIVHISSGKGEIDLSNMKDGIYILSYYEERTNRYINYKILKK